MIQTLWILFATIIGVFLAMQGAINSQLGKITQLPVFASLASFTIGTLTLTLPFIFRIIPFPEIQKLTQIPWYLWSGGLLGAIFVTSAIIVIPQIGITLFLGFVIFGQLCFGLIIDHFGLFGLDNYPISLSRVLGVSLILVGALLTR